MANRWWARGRERLRASDAVPGRRGWAIGVIPATLAVSLFIILFDNNHYWWIVGNTVGSTEHPNVVSLLMFLLLLGGLNVTLALSVGQRGFKLTAIFLLLVASVVGFYMSQFGVAVDSAIVRSLFETDAREASTLLSGSLFVHVALYGVLPAIAVWFLPLKPSSWKRDLTAKTALIVLSLLAPTVGIYADYLEFSFYGQANRQVRLFMNPLYPVYATGQYVREVFATQGDVEKILASGASRLAHASAQKPLAIVLVLGETARADHWSLNGYERDTNQFTAKQDVINFPDVVSCGTSTADSLPCIFSPLPRAEFSHVAAAEQEGLLALLKRLSIDVRWVDNSTGCKEICADEDFVSIAGAEDPELCDAHGCYDEMLLGEIQRRPPALDNDAFIVLHERGSHGPTYYQNVPADAKAYLPECTLDTFRDCDDQSLINAYDNTILYGDLFLARLIDYLRTLERTHDVAMLYVSDHGESLGEGGIYLHGFPYVLAPTSQKKVPMLFWASAGYYERSGLDRQCLETVRNRPSSHDAIFHTALGLAEVRTDNYRDDLDLFAQCRDLQRVSMIVADSRSPTATKAE